MRRLASLLLIALLSPAPATHASDSISVQMWWAFCRFPKDDGDRTICRSYISGVLDTMVVVGAVGDGKTAKTIGVCHREYLTYDTAVQAFIAWAEKHAESWDEPRSSGVIQALSETWPCGAKK